MATYKQLQREYTKTRHIPLILKLDVAGTPRKWIHWHEATVLAFNDKVKWSYGEPIILRGGTNRHGEQSTFALPPVIAADDVAKKFRTPPVNNRELFRRDRNICGYCSAVLKNEDATRDHIVPRSKGGKDVWTNVVCCCQGCNRVKSDKTLEESGMQLVYVPYTPCAAEYLLLQYRNVLADQMDYLEKRIPASSRYWQN